MQSNTNWTPLLFSAFLYFVSGIHYSTVQARYCPFAWTGWTLASKSDVEGWKRGLDQYQWARWQGKDECTCTYFAMLTMYPNCFPNGRDGNRSYMKGCAAFSDRIASTVGITAMGAAFTDNLVLSTSVCCKILKVRSSYYRRGPVYL
jgi:hypothetical protein